MNDFVEKCRILALRNLGRLPRRQLHGQVGRDAPGQVHVVLPLFLRQADVLGPPVGDAGFHRLLGGDGQLLSGQWVVPRGQALDLAGLVRGEGRGTKSRTLCAQTKALNGINPHQQGQ